MAYDTIIFDMDGTLINSRGKGEISYRWARDALKKTMKKFGVEWRNGIDEIFLSLITKKGGKGLEEFCKMYKIKDIHSFWRERERDVIEAKISAIDSGEITLYDSVRRIVGYLSNKYALAIVSDSQQECVEHAVRHFDLVPYFRVWYGRGSELEDLKKLKPEPDYILRVLEELGSNRAVLVDDSPYSILAAEKAGIDSILLLRGKKEILKEPDYIIDDLMELKKIL
ncbi:MAG: HAD family hydrolase [Candidatus Syntropharchaeia archaeon]